MRSTYLYDGGSRLSTASWAMGIALMTAERSTCIRRAVGCVLLDGRNRLLATGVNGVASGAPHCNESAVDMSDAGDMIPPEGRSALFVNACPGAFSPSGSNIGGCGAIHAEQNALLQCRDPDAVHSCFVTTSPCESCVKLLLGTRCHSIVFADAYVDQTARGHWERAGRSWNHWPYMGRLAEAAQDFRALRVRS